MLGKIESRPHLAVHPIEAIEAGVIPTMDMKDLADCDYVLEAASENLDVKKHGVVSDVLNRQAFDFVVVRRVDVMELSKPCYTGLSVVALALPYLRRFRIPDQTLFT